MPFPDLLAERANDPAGNGSLPTHRITWTGGEAFAWSDSQAMQIVEQNGLRFSGLDTTMGNGHANGASDAAPLASIRELHENREIESIIEDLKAFDVDIDDYALTQEEAVTGETLPTKYAWLTSAKAAKKADDADGEDGEGETSSGRGAKALEAVNVPGILDALRDLGRKGMEIKRFKGLGEMDPEQLWETTMDYSTRTLMRVTWDQGEAADELFTTLMGENVENRRTYIEDHALEVKQLDV